MKDPQLGPNIEVSQERAIEELEEIPAEEKIREDLHCNPTVHTRYRSLLGRIDWIQSRRQFQCWCKFSSCASRAVSPTIGDVKALYKVARQLKSKPVKLQFWPLTGPLIIIGFPDASYRNNEDGSSQRGMTAFFGRIARGMSYRSLVDDASQKIQRTVLSTTVAGLHSFIKCCGSCQFLRGLWIDMSGEVAEIHMRTDAKNLVTTARTFHLPEQKGNNPYDVHVAKGSLFRKYSWSCSHFNSKLFGRLLDEVIGESRQFDQNNENREIIGSCCSSKLDGTRGAKVFLIKWVQNIHAHKKRNMFSSWTL